MRTASILARGHGTDGKWVVLADPDVPIQEQTQMFRKFRGPRSHPEYSIIQYQERDGHALTLRFMSPDAEKAHNDQREAERQAFKAKAEADARSTSDATKAADTKREEKHKAEVAEHSKNLEKSKASWTVPSKKPAEKPAEKPAKDTPKS